MDALVKRLHIESHPKVWLLGVVTLFGCVLVIGSCQRDSDRNANDAAIRQVVRDQDAALRKVVRDSATKQRKSLIDGCEKGRTRAKEINKLVRAATTNNRLFREHLISAKAVVEAQGNRTAVSAFNQGIEDIDALPLLSPVEVTANCETAYPDPLAKPAP